MSDKAASYARGRCHNQSSVVATQKRQAHARFAPRRAGERKQRGRDDDEQDVVQHPRREKRRGKRAEGRQEDHRQNEARRCTRSIAPSPERQNSDQRHRPGIEVPTHQDFCRSRRGAAVYAFPASHETAKRPLEAMRQRVAIQQAGSMTRKRTGNPSTRDCATRTAAVRSRRALTGISAMWQMRGTAGSVCPTCSGSDVGRGNPALCRHQSRQGKGLFVPSPDTECSGEFLAGQELLLSGAARRRMGRRRDRRHPCSRDGKNGGRARSARPRMMVSGRGSPPFPWCRRIS